MFICRVASVFVLAHDLADCNRWKNWDEWAFVWQAEKTFKEGTFQKEKQPCSWHRICALWWGLNDFKTDQFLWWRLICFPGTDGGIDNSKIKSTTTKKKKNFNVSYRQSAAPLLYKWLQTVSSSWLVIRTGSFPYSSTLPLRNTKCTGYCPESSPAPLRTSYASVSVSACVLGNVPIVLWNKWFLSVFWLPNPPCFDRTSQLVLE